MRTYEQIYEESLEKISKYKNKQFEWQQYDGLRKAIDIPARAMPIMDKDPILGANLLQRMNVKNEIDHIYEIYENNKYDISALGESAIREIIAYTNQVEQKILDIDLHQSRTNIEEYLIETKSRGITAFSYDFFDVTRAIESNYQFQISNILNMFLKQDVIVNEILKDLGFSEEEIKIGHTLSPVENNDVTRLSSIIGHYMNDILPYKDYWHHLLDNDFLELNKNGTNYMYVEPLRNEDLIYSKIRQIYALECAKAIDHDAIAFLVSW